MKTLIVALNSKYIHLALAPWYLKAACGDSLGEVRVLEHTINENADSILASLYMQKPDVAAFSCYIWNISLVLRLAANLKKLLPQTVIVLGGPEVSYDTEDILKEYEFVDYILAGEGEISFPKLLRRIDGADEAFIEGLAFRSGDGIVSVMPAVVEQLGEIPSPYTDEMLLSFKNRIVYFETSRGCPFSCSYCLSSASESVRYFPMERVLRELDRLVAAGVGQIKFVDRTFNANRERAKRIIRHILELDKPGLNCNFHFEVGADLFDEELLQLLAGAPKGLFQLEAGVQTVNEAALAAVCRKTDTDKLLDNLVRIRGKNNIHVHADLIAGLPHEDYSSFENSFSRLYSVRPHQLQLGFLKFLKGTGLRYAAENEGYRFSSFPPYEILSGKDISYDELVVLKGIAELVDRYYNSSRFVFSLEYVISRYFTSPFKFYESFYHYQKLNGYMYTNIGLKDLYAIFYGFASDFMDEEGRAELIETLRLDFLASDNSGTLPDFFEKRSSQGFNEKCYDFLKNTERVAGIMPEATGMNPKQLRRKVHFDIFYFDNEVAVLIFNYIMKDKVTGRYPFYRTDIEVSQ